VAESGPSRKGSYLGNTSSKRLDCDTLFKKMPSYDGEEDNYETSIRKVQSSPLLTLSFGTFTNLSGSGTAVGPPSSRATAATAAAVTGGGGQTYRMMSSCQERRIESILIVDDAKSNRSIMHRILKRKLCILCYVMLCYVMLCYVMLCYFMICYVM
jgi:hypothetical protein